jgi:hypothetical protein
MSMPLRRTFDAAVPPFASPMVHSSMVMPPQPAMSFSSMAVPPPVMAFSSTDAPIMSESTATYNVESNLINMQQAQRLVQKALNRNNLN